MKIIFKLFLSAFTLLFYYPLSSQENTLLWKISGNGLSKSSYLFGTYHSQDYRAHQYGDSVFPKLLKAETIVVENIDLESGSNKKMFDLALMKDKKLENLLKKSDYDFVKENILDKLGTSGLFFNNMKPIFTIIMAQQALSRKEMNYTVDDFIKQSAKKNKKKMFGLETGEEAIQSISAIPIPEQCNMLIDFFKNYDQGVKLSDSIINLYQKQDLNNLYKVYSNNNNITEAFDENLLIKRNIKFIERVIPLIKEQSCFIAVGALHLPGETGLINALRKKGYTVSPIYSQYKPKTLVINDTRKWFDYDNDSLMINMKFPNDPFLEIQTSSDSLKTNTLNYFYNDSVFDVQYAISIVNILDTTLINNPNLLYAEVINNLSSQRWIKTKNNLIVYNEHNASEAEFNISKGLNIRYKIVSNGSILYLISIMGKKEILYSSLADHFFNEIFISNPTLFLKLNLTDEEGKEFDNNFKVEIKSDFVDTIISSDDTNYIYFTLPQKEDKYIIKIISNGYVSKQILINTFGISNLGKKEIYLTGEMSMLKKNNTTNYTIFNTPIARASIFNATSFTWDFNYINKMKLEVKKAIETHK